MKVALYMDTPRVGGAERYLADLCERLAQRESIDLHILSPARDLVAYLRSRLKGAAAIHVLGRSPRFGDNLFANVVYARHDFRELRMQLRMIQPDIFHINNGGYPGSQLARAAVFATGSIRVMTVNSRAQPRRGGARQLYRMFDRVVWAALARVIVPADAAAADLAQYRKCPEDLITVIPYGIPEPAIDSHEVERLRKELAPHDELVVGIVVAPTHDPAVSYKGHNVLLEAAGLLPRDDVRFAIVGHDPGAPFRTRAQELEVGDRFSIYSGFRDTTDFMAAFDALTVPSTRSEGLPLVVLEAMASGTPVIGSRLSGIPEAISNRENGFLFEPGNPEELARIIGECAEDRQTCDRLGQRARATFHERFTSEEMVDRTLAIYDELQGESWRASRDNYGHDAQQNFRDSALHGSRPTRKHRK